MSPGNGWRLPRAAATLIDRIPIPDRVPTVGLGLLVALLGWNVIFQPASPGLDASWSAGLAMAAHDHLQFGPEIIYTYGPLGFMGNTYLWYGGLASISFIYFSCLLIALTISLIWVSRRAVGATLAAVATLLILIAAIDQPIALAMIWSFVALRDDERPRHLVVLIATVGAVLAAMFTLVKLSTGPAIAVILLITLIGVRARRWQIGAYVGIYLASLLLLWIASGQAIANIDEFVRYGAQIALGYGDAMSAPRGPFILVPLSVLMLVAGFAATVRGEFPDRRARICGTLAYVVAGYLIYREGIVRLDAGHVAILIGTMTVIWIAIPWSRSRTWIQFGGAALILLAAIYVLPSGTNPQFNPIHNVVRAKDQARMLVSGGLKSDAIDRGRATLHSVYGLDQETLSLVEGRTVSIDPWEAAVAWAYELDWDPLPVFQNYAAYTEPLDRLNADAVRGPGAPSRILRANPPMFEGFQTRSIDGRYPAWDPPRQSIAILCNYRILNETSAWQTLGLVGDRCSRPRPAGTATASTGQVVKVPAPAPDEVVYAGLHGVGPTGLEKIKAALYRANARSVTTSSGATYRIVTATAGDGLLLRGGGKVGQDQGPFAQIPQAKSISIDGIRGDAEIEFFRMKLRRPLLEPDSGVPDE